MADDLTALTVFITGRVQGVGYRDWTRRQAAELGLKGWVRNESDGTVRALIIGSNAAVAEMARRCWKGPQFASVTDVKTEVATIDEIPADFRITRG